LSGYLLDTNIISNALKPKPNEGIAVWLSAQRERDLFLSAVSVGEMAKGIALLPASKRQRDLQAALDYILASLGSRILPFDLHCALRWGELLAEGQPIGRTRPDVDTMIAATASVHGLIVVTQNIKDFTGSVEAYNPAS
jgi:predicted nucleic acid-binding protein